MLACACFHISLCKQFSELLPVIFKACIDFSHHWFYWAKWLIRYTRWETIFGGFVAVEHACNGGVRNIHCAAVCKCQIYKNRYVEIVCFQCAGKAFFLIDKSRQQHRRILCREPPSTIGPVLTHIPHGLFYLSIDKLDLSTSKPIWPAAWLNVWICDGRDNTRLFVWVFWTNRWEHWLKGNVGMRQNI